MTRLHRFIDEYMDTVRDDLSNKFRRDGNEDSLNQLLREIREMIMDLRLQDKNLYSRLPLNKAPRSCTPSKR